MKKKQAKKKPLTEKEVLNENKEGLIFIGKYNLGLVRVDLFGNIKTRGGAFEYKPGDLENGALPRVIVGMDYNRANKFRLLEILSHEAYEAAFCQMNCRYVLDGAFCMGSDMVFFNCNHNQFSEVVSMASFFIFESWPDLSNKHEEIYSFYEKKKKAK